MKAEFTNAGFLKVTPENMAESIALKYMFVTEQDSDKWVSQIVIDSNLPDEPVKAVKVRQVEPILFDWSNVR